MLEFFISWCKHGEKGFEGSCTNKPVLRQKTSGDYGANGLGETEA